MSPKFAKLWIFFYELTFLVVFFWSPKIAPFLAQIFHHLLHFHNFAFSKYFTTCCTLRVFENSLEKSWHIELTLVQVRIFQFNVSTFFQTIFKDSLSAAGGETFWNAKLWKCSRWWIIWAENGAIFGPQKILPKS